MPYTKNYDLDTDTTLGGDNASDYVAASQKATKTYIDNHSGGGGANTDLSNLTATGEAHFQKPLVSGTNIKTVNNTSLLGSGNIDTSEIFIAEYGVTSYADVLAAYNAGKTIICQYESNITSSLKIIYNLYLINFATNTTFNFSGTISGTAQYFYTNLTSSGWASVSDKTCETTSNKVTSISSSSTNAQYPSAKCIYDNYQQKLVSGTNIKTINSNSLLGSGNIYITPGHTWGTTRPTSTTSTVSSTNPAVVIQNYINGTSWYRVYSDGWCEQGGKSVSSSNLGYRLVTISLLKPYIDTNYSAFVTSRYNAKTESGTNYIRSESPTEFEAAVLGYGYAWQACGYIR